MAASLKRARAREMKLLTKTKLLNDSLVTLKFILLQVVEKFSPAGCHHQQSPAGVKVLAVGFKMFRKVGDPGSEQGDLHLAGPGVLVVGTIFFDD